VKKNSDKIAVVAVAARCAGADDVDEFENLLDSCRPQFCEAPPSRWQDPSVPLAEFPDALWKSYSNVMAPISDPYELDGFQFRIPLPRLKRMDPQQRLVINLAAQLFGGVDEEHMRRGETATVIGVSSTDYRGIAAWPVMNQMMLGLSRETLSPSTAQDLAEAESRIEPTGAHSMPGVMTNMIATCVASAFDLTGPAFTIDAACASGLAAVDIGCLLLRSRRVDSCVAGGVYVALTPEPLVGFSAVGAVSPSGRCVPFEQSADGFVLGEGAGLVLLKRLDDALADGDDVLCVIDGVGSSNDGRASGVMTPTREGQVKAVRDAWAQAGLPLDTVDAIEAHGTGTVVGDAIELEAISEVFGTSGRRVPIGSLKAIVGHTMAAAGVLSLIKVVLAVRRGTWFSQPSPGPGSWNERLDRDAFYLPTGLEPVAPVRRAAMNSFGFGGTNYHAILSSLEAVHDPA